MIDKRGNFHVRTGVVVFKNDFFPQVIDKLEFDLKSAEGKLKYENWPFLIFRSPSGTYKSQCSTNIKCWKDYLETQNPVGPAIDQFVQKYIIPKGSRHTDTYYAGFVRVVYHTRAVRIAEPHLIRHPMNRKRLKRKVGRDPIANYGFRIRNKIYEILDDEAKGLLRTNTWNSKKKKGGPNLDRRGVVNTEEKNSFEVYKIQGESLSIYEKMCNKVVQFLQQSYSIRINRIVLDFITDSDNKVWLFNCKSLRIDDKVYMHQQEQANKVKKTLDDLTCSVYCKLCGLIFKKTDASKVLTCKLLWELVQHLKKRKLPLKDIEITQKQNISKTRPVRVCNLCYMLVVAEHELIEDAHCYKIEQKFAKVSNIPIGNALVRVPIDQKPRHRPALLSAKLLQWRILFFVHNLQDWDKNKKLDTSNLYLQIKLHQSRTCWKIKFPLTPEQKLERLKKKSRKSKNNYEKVEDYREIEVETREAQNITYHHLKFMRVLYFFSENQDIGKFINDTMIYLRITRGTDWGKDVIAEGTTKTLSQFNNKQKNGQMHDAKILLFLKDASNCLLKMSVGLMQDQKYNTENFNLYKYNNIYFPDENYYNTNEFPKVWMEIFDSKKNIVKRTQQDHTDLAIYAPNCTNKELARMLHAESEKRMKYKNAESKLKDYISGSQTYQETVRQNQSQNLKKNISVGKLKIPEFGTFKEIKRSTLMKKAKKRRPQTGRRYQSNKRQRSGFMKRPQTGRMRPQTGRVKFASGGGMRARNNKRQRPLTTRRPPRSIMSAKNYLKQRGKGGEMDYEIQLLNNLLTSDYTGAQSQNKPKSHLKDAYNIILDQDLKDETEKTILSKYNLIETLEEDISRLNSEQNSKVIYEEKPRKKLKPIVKKPQKNQVLTSMELKSFMADLKKQKMQS